MRSRNNLLRILRDSKKEADPAKDFLGDLNRSIEMTNENNEREMSQFYTPSSMLCRRNMAYRRMGTKPDPDKAVYNFIGILESGTDRHERLQEAVTRMKDNGMDCEYIDVAEYIAEKKIPYVRVMSKEGHETKLRHTILNLSFLCDGIIRYKDEYYILEIKTEISFKWNNRTGVDDAHKNQATTYALCLGIPRVIFIYESRDVCDRKAYLFEVTPEMEKELSDMLTSTEEFVQRGEVPPAEPSKMACRYCRYKSICGQAVE